MLHYSWSGYIYCCWDCWPWLWYLQNINILVKQRKYCKSKAKQTQNIQQYKISKQNNFNEFIQNIKQPIKRQNDDEQHHGIIGCINAGKTSFINYSCGLKLKVGLGETTQQCKDVAQISDGKIHIWDCPGDNQQFGIYKQESVKFFLGLNKIFILYCDSLKNCKEIVTVLLTMKHIQFVLNVIIGNKIIKKLQNNNWKLIKNIYKVQNSKLLFSHLVLKKI